MNKMIDIRFHGRGGQGVVTAARILAEALFKTGKWTQMIPFYEGERRGAPVKAFLRIDEKPVRITSQVSTPYCIVVLDPILPKVEDVTAGLKEGGIALFNEAKHPEELDIGVKLSKIGVVDATSIAVKVFGRTAIPITNTAMIGAFSAFTRWVELDILSDIIKRIYPGEIGEKNIEALKKGYKKVQIKTV